MQLRLAFPIVFLMLLGGLLGSRWIFSTLSGALLPQASQHVAAQTTGSKPHTHATATPIHSAPRHVKHRTAPVRHVQAQPTAPAPATPRPLPTVTPTSVPTVAPLPTATTVVVIPTPVVHHAVHTTHTAHAVHVAPAVRPVHHARHRVVRAVARHRRGVAVRRSTPHPTATPHPTPQPTTGTIVLTNYYVTSSSARTGQTVSVVYTIDNGTGHTVHLMLGASIKSMRVANWAAGAINDPSHDVVAVAPPGITTHLRYFTLAPSLRPGAYDVGWGLRDAATGQSVAFLAAPGALRVMK